MSRYTGQLYHPVNHRAENIYEGFSWPCLLFGCFWYLVKGMLGWAAAAFFLSIVTFGLSWFVLPFFANKQYMEHLIKSGYLTKEQVDKRERPA